MAAELTNELGELRSFQEFKKAAKPIYKKYNENWLEAEYNSAVRSARMANEWKEIQKTKHLYPNLEYQPSVAAEPRDEHKSLYYVVKPIDDPFWDRWLPPNGWGCKCSVARTDKEPTKETPEADDPIPGIPGNSGKSGQLFAPSHPFIKNTSKKEKAKVKEQLEKLERAAIRDDVREWSRKGLQGSSASAAGVDFKIMFTGRGIKEALNQPHKHFNDKNLLIRDIKQVVKKGKYIGSRANDKGGRGVVRFHYWEIQVKGEKSWVVVRELSNGEFHFYTIVDKMKKGS